MSMKKILTIVLLFVFSLPVLASNWVELFEKKYVDMETVEFNPRTQIVTFWLKALRTDPKDKILDKDYWYTLSHWNISCKDRTTKIENIVVYDLKGNIISSGYKDYNWEAIIPDTYAEGYYKIFCQPNN